MKRLIKLTVPSISATYELAVPEFLTVGQVIPLLVEGVREMSNSSYISSGAEFLCLERFEMPLSEKYTLEEYGIMNGDQLYLI